MKHKDELEGLQRLSHIGECKHCRVAAWEEWEGPPNIMFGAVPGGTRPASFSKAKSDKFHKDMYAFEGAVKNGLDPEMVSVEAVERAERIAYGAESPHDIYFR